MDLAPAFSPDLRRGLRNRISPSERVPTTNSRVEAEVFANEMKGVSFVIVSVQIRNPITRLLSHTGTANAVVGPVKGSWKNGEG